jgi:hypothetical protein
MSKDVFVPVTLVKFDDSFKEDKDFANFISKELVFKRKQYHATKFHGDSDKPQTWSGEKGDTYWLWVFSYKTENLPPWIHLLEKFIPSEHRTTIDNGIANPLNTSFHAILAIKVNGHYYGFLFGAAPASLVAKHLDRNFGINLAERVFDHDSIVGVESKHLGVTANKTIQEYYGPSFYLPKYGEIVASIKGELHCPSDDVEVKNTFDSLALIIKPDLQVSYNSVDFTLRSSKGTDLDIFRQVVVDFQSILDTVKDNLYSIPVLTRLTKKESEPYDSALFEMIKEKDDTLMAIFSSLSYAAEISKIPANRNYELRLSDSFKTTTTDCDIRDLSKKEIFNFISSNQKFKNLDDVRVVIHHDDNDCVIGGLKDFLDAEMVFNGKELLLYEGFWCEYNKNFAEELKEQVGSCLKDQKVCKSSFVYDYYDVLKKCKDNDEFLSAFQFKAPEKGKEPGYAEARLNYCYALSDQKVGLFDRKLVEEGGRKFEVCDLYDSTNAMLIHVKIGEPSSLLEAFNQALLSAKFIHKNPAKEYSAASGPSFQAQNITKIKVLYYCTNTNVFDIGESQSLALWLAYTSWYSELQRLGYAPVLEIVQIPKPDKAKIQEILNK